jgi:hypothetical protein
MRSPAILVTFMAFLMTMMSMHRMRAAAESHHEVKKSCEKKKLQYPRVHRPKTSSRSPRQAFWRSQGRLAALFLRPHLLGILFHDFRVRLHHLGMHLHHFRRCL